MGVNLDKVLKQQQQMKERARSFSRVKINRFKPKVGENRIRVMPPWADEGPNEGQFWRELLQHWNIGEGGYQEEGGRIFLCPLRTPDGPGSDCDVCDFVKSLYESDSPSDAELAKEIAAKRTYVMNVVDLKDAEYTEDDVDEWNENNEDECPFEIGDTKVKAWSCSEARFKDLVDVMTDEIDFTDLESGHDVVVTREGKGKFSTRYRVRVHPSPSSFKFKGDFSSLVYDLDNIFRFPKEGDMRKTLNGEDTSFPSGNSSSLPSKEDKEEKALPEPKEEPPECYKDLETQDDKDPQCVGGEDEDGDTFEPCPWLEPCKEAKLASQKPKKKRSPKRRSDTKMSEGAEDLDKQLKEALK